MILEIKEVQVKNVITKSNLPISDYSINPYVGCPHACKYCYASFMKRFTNHKEPWGTFVDVKFWPEIKNIKKYDGKEFFLGSVTDPYNPLEKKYERTRALLNELKGSNVKISIQTKSDLVLRDIDIIKTFKNIRVGFSINTLSEDFKNDMDKAVSIKRRIDAMKKLYSEKIKTACFISPIFPALTDVKAIIDAVKDKCNFIWLENLNLRGDYKEYILNYIKTKYPKIFPLYEEIYCKGNLSYFKNLDNELSKFLRENNLKYVINDDTIYPDFGEPPVVVNFFYHEKIRKNNN